METIITKLFNVDYPEDCDNPNVGSVYDVYEKGFKSAMNFKKEGIDLTQLQADKAELLEALYFAKRHCKKPAPVLFDKIESLIQKNKQ